MSSQIVDRRPVLR